MHALKQKASGRQQILVSTLGVSAKIRSNLHTGQYAGTWQCSIWLVVDRCIGLADIWVLQIYRYRPKRPQ